MITQILIWYNNALLFSGLSLSKKILPGQVVSVKVEPPLNIHHDQKNPAARLVQLVAAANSVASDGRQVSAPNILKRAKPGATTITLAPKRQMVSTTTYVTTIPSPPSSTTSSINRYILGVSPSLVSRYVKATVSGGFVDLKFKISEGSDQNWSCPGSAL